MPALSPAPCTEGTDSTGLKTVDWLMLHADRVVTCDEAMTCISDGALALDGGIIVGVGPSSEIAARFRGRTTLDMRGHLLMPGLINTHTHAAMTLFRGLGNDLPLHRWLFEVVFPAEGAHLSPGFVYEGTLLACAEMLLNGVTTFSDGYFFEEAAAEACAEAGIRAVLGQGIIDFPVPDNPDPARWRERAERFLEVFPSGNPLLRPSFCCHSPTTCRNETLQGVKALCREHGLLFQIHLSETALDREDIVRLHGVSPVAHLDNLGLLDAMTLCAHGVWLDEAERQILAERRTGLSHNVESNMKLASGAAPVLQLLEAGVRVGLGTDGCASNNDLDLFSEMDRTAKLHKVIARDPTVLSAARVLTMATREGASVLGWGDAVGSLEPGKQADVAAIDVNQPHLVPLYNPVSHLVYAVRGSDVRHVWVGGRQVVVGGRLPHLDLPALLASARRRAKAIQP